MRYALPFCVGLLALAGCAGTGEKAARGNAPQEDEQMTVTAAHTPFYRFGPAQATGPDLSLAKDALVTVVQPARGFSRVRTQEGEIGYVPNDRLAPAPAPAFSDVLPPMRVDDPPQELEMVTLEELLQGDSSPKPPLPGATGAATPAPSAPSSALPGKLPELRVSDPPKPPTSHGSHDHQ